MAAGRDGEHTRFPFLATVRSLVATVVTVLGVAVVVMVIVVVHRPVEMVFRSDGLVLAEDWWLIENNTTPRDADSLVSYAYGPAGDVDILLTLDAVNPSGRGQIKGSINRIRVIDIQNMVEICFFEPRKFGANASFYFDLRPHSSHRYKRSVRIWHKEQLQYLYDNHSQDASGFSVLLVVETTYQPRAHSKKSMSYYCSPVTFFRIRGATPKQGGDVICKTAQDMGYKPNIESTTDCNVAMP